MEKKVYKRPLAFITPKYYDVMQVITPSNGQDFSNKSQTDFEEDPVTEETGKSFWDN